MKMRLYQVILFLTAFAQGQTSSTTVIPSITRFSPDPHTAMVIRLSPGYTSSVKLPEEVNAVVVGNPATFKAEHSETEPRIVFFKPITMQPDESNALITMKSGKALNFHLKSWGRQATEQKIDFFVEYEEPQALLVRSPGPSSFVIPESLPPADSGSVGRDTPIDKTSAVLEEALAQQRREKPVGWKGKGLEGAIGLSTENDHRIILGFSVRNGSDRVIEILPPQIQLSGRASNRRKEIKADPIPILAYRITTRRLAPGDRADGVIAFERPGFKESAEELRLQLAQAEEVDHPLLLPFSFTLAAGGVE